MSRATYDKEYESMRIPILTLKSNYCDWTYFVQSAFYGRDWEEIYNWMNGGPASPAWQSATSQSAIACAPAIAAIAAAPATTAIAAVPAAPVATRSGRALALPAAPAPPADNPAATRVQPPLLAPIPAASNPQNALPGLPNDRRKAWAAISTSIGPDVMAKISVKPKVGNLVELWKSIQNCFFRSTAISKNAIKTKLTALTLTSSGGPDAYLAALIDYFDLLARAGSPVDDQDKSFHLLKGLPAEYHHFKTALDVSESRSGSPHTFDEMRRSFQTYVQANQTEPTLSDSHNALFSNGSSNGSSQAKNAKAWACRNFRERL